MHDHSTNMHKHILQSYTKSKDTQHGFTLHSKRPTDNTKTMQRKREHLNIKFTYFYMSWIQEHAGACYKILNKLSFSHFYPQRCFFVLPNQNCMGVATAFWNQTLPLVQAKCIFQCCTSVTFCLFAFLMCGYVHCTIMFIVLGIVVFYSVRVRYCISSYTPYFSHTINISNDQTLILDIAGSRRKKKSLVLLLNQHYMLDCLHASRCVWFASHNVSQWLWIVPLCLKVCFVCVCVCVCVHVCVCVCVCAGY